MGEFDPKQNERELWTSMFLESAKFWGTPVTIELVESYSFNKIHTPTTDRALPKALDIILDQRPKTEALRELHWYNEDDEIKPILAYISIMDLDMDDINALRGVRINLPFQIGITEGTKIYEITDAKVSPPVSLFWVCKLVPVRDTYEQNQDPSQDPNYTFIKVNTNG